MGKLFFVVLCLLGGVYTIYTQDKKSDSTPMDTATVVRTKYLEDSFFLIRPIEVPNAVNGVIKAYFPTASIKSAYVNKVGQYKLEVVLRDGRSGYLYVDRDGNWIER